MKRNNEVMILNTYKEDYEKAVDISKKIKQNNQLPIFSTSFFMNSINDTKRELDEALDFFEKAMTNPILLFSQAKEYWGCHRNILYRVIEYQGRKNKKGTIHEFQSFLAVKMNEVLQSWLEQNGIEKELTIEVRNPNTFPSIYAIFLDTKEIMQFNIFEQFYGSKNKGQKEEDILKAGQREEIRLKEEEKKDQAKLDDLYAFQKKPFSRILTPRDFYHIVIRHRRTMERLQDLIKNQERKLEATRERIQRNRDQLPYVLKDNEERRKLFALIELFFFQFDYLLETENHKLY